MQWVDWPYHLARSIPHILLKTIWASLLEKGLQLVFVHLHMLRAKKEIQPQRSEWVAVRLQYEYGGVDQIRTGESRFCKPFP